MRAHLLSTALSLLLLAGCLGGGEVIPVQYYSVDTPPETVPQATRSWPLPLGMRAFTAASRYRDRILYRASPVEVGFYEYHRWVEPPEEMLTRLTAMLLRASGLFQQVVAADEIQLPAWVLSGEVVRFDEVREAAERRAELWLRVELRQVPDERLLWADTLRASVPLAAPSPEALAQAMRQAAQQIGTQLIAELQKASPPRL